MDVREDAGETTDGDALGCCAGGALRSALARWAVDLADRGVDTRSHRTPLTAATKVGDATMPWSRGAVMPGWCNAQRAIRPDAL
jgi:hypothetical protein